jgi:protein-tyrosine-phosphatase
MAAAFFREAVADLPVRVSSMGTLDLGGIPPLPEALSLGPKLGIDLSRHRTRALAGNRLSDADLVVGFERMHLVTAVVDGGARRERAFTLPELVGLLEGAEIPNDAEPIERARAAVAAAQGRRPRSEELVGRPELPDPLGGSADVYRWTAEAVREQTSRLAAALFGAAAS